MLVAAPLTARGDHTGVNPPGGAGSIALIIGPAASNGSGPANVSFDLSANPQLVGAGTPIDGTPAILIEVGVRPSCVFFGWFGLAIGLELRAVAPPALQAGTNQIPIDRISWTSVLPGGAGYTNLIPAGTFASGDNVYTRNFPFGGCSVRWMGAEVTFQFANDAVYPAGTYTGTVQYSAQVP